VAGDIVAELETDKATLEIESPVAGYVKRLLVGQGDAVDPGQAIAEIAEDGDA
jgi:pyruvate/2-oxoglutarate dehydrogenase complex dihydrolipoamide acyltransferase (E2) component